MSASKDPPASYSRFVQRYPGLGKAWDLVRDAEKQGPLDGKTVRLLKLAIAMGALREGAVHSGVRKALAAGVSPEEIEHLVALAPGVLGFPSAVAVHTWIMESIEESRA